MKKNKRNKVWAVLLAFLLCFSAGVAAFDFTITFGEGITHLFESFTGNIPSADTTKYYYQSNAGYSTDIADAIPFETIDINGSLQFVDGFTKTGQCSWFAVISASQPTESTTKINFNDLNDTSVLADRNVWVAVKPNSTSVTDCGVAGELKVV